MRPSIVRNTALACTLIGATSCANMFAAKTRATHIEHPDGRREITYESTKEQLGMDVKLGDMHVKVDRSSTQEEVVNATLQTMRIMERLTETLNAIAVKYGAPAAAPAVPMMVPAK